MRSAGVGSGVIYDKQGHILSKLLLEPELSGRVEEVVFDYRLRPGLATSRNALRLMQIVGLEVPEDDRSAQ